jgi:hypothetical protein
MLERALKLKKALYNAALTDKNLVKYKLSENEWIIVSEIHKLMQVCNLLINVIFVLHVYFLIILYFICNISRKVQILLLDNFIPLFYLAFQPIVIY